MKIPSEYNFEFGRPNSLIKTQEITQFALKQLDLSLV